MVERRHLGVLVTMDPVRLISPQSGRMSVINTMLARRLEGRCGGIAHPLVWRVRGPPGIG
jgi:hypothetical protein